MSMTTMIERIPHGTSTVDADAPYLATARRLYLIAKPLSFPNATAGHAEPRDDNSSRIAGTVPSAHRCAFARGPRDPGHRHRLHSNASGTTAK
jgi:hypothetical protein